MKKNAILIGLGSLVVLLFAGNAAHFYRLGLVDQLSATLYDYHLKFISPETVLYRIYAERVVYFRGNPPAADWDGVFVFQTK